MGHGVRKTGSGSEKTIRLSRGQSHDLLTRLENVGLTAEIASMIVEGDEGNVRAMIAAVSGLDRWVDKIRTWFQTNRFDNVEVPPLNVSLGERVERALRMQVPFYLPSWRAFTARDLFNLPSSSRTLRIDPRWHDVRVADPPPFYTPIMEGYWFWMEIGGRHGQFDREQAARQEHRPYFTAEEITARAALLEEFLIGFFVGEALGRPLQFGRFGEPARSLVLQPQVQRMHDRDEFLISRGLLEKGQELGSHRMTAQRGFNWSTATLGDLCTAHDAHPDCWDYCWVERIPASAAKAA